MIKLNVDGMKCGHCVKRVTDAIRRVEPHVPVQVNLTDRSVHIDAANEFAPQFAAVIAQAGYRVIDSREPAKLKQACGCCA